MWIVKMACLVAPFRFLRQDAGRTLPAETPRGSLALHPASVSDCHFNFALVYNTTESLIAAR